MKYTGRIYFSNNFTLDINYDVLSFIDEDPDQLLFKKKVNGYYVPVALFSLKNIAGFVYNLNESVIKK